MIKRGVRRWQLLIRRHAVITCLSLCLSDAFMGIYSFISTDYVQGIVLGLGEHRHEKNDDSVVGACDKGA